MNLPPFLPFPICYFTQYNIRSILLRIFYTRMLGMRNLLIPHAPLETGLPFSKCSPVFCEPRALPEW